MNTIDIKDFRKYSSEELRQYADKGLLYCDGHGLREFMGKILEGMISEEEAEKIASETAKESGETYADGWEAAIEEIRQKLEFM